MFKPNLNETHDPKRKSWVESANRNGCPFPIQNLPFGIFSHEGDSPRVGVAIGDYVLDLALLEAEGLITAGSEKVFNQRVLNPFMALGKAVWSKVRKDLSALLEAGNPALRDNADLRQRALYPQERVEMHMPFFVRSFTDFYASKEHATNVGTMFRDPENALMPNWLHIPIGYNGRASTVVKSGTDIIRPYGQLKRPDEDMPRLAPSMKLDFELELGAVVGGDTALGARLSTNEAYDLIFGYVLLNDWSARDIQVWEYQPLGPFQSKAFASSISPWVITSEALEPFRCPPPERIKDLLPYLQEETPNNFNISLEVLLGIDGQDPTTICRTNARHLYYSSAQQLAHHALSGCAMCVGDLLGSGTISGSAPDSFGSLLELSWNGQRPVEMPNGEKRSFLEDGDEVILRGACYRDGITIGFGECRGHVVAAR